MLSGAPRTAAAARRIQFFGEEARFFDEIGLRLALSDLLGVDVDVIGSDALRGAFRERVLREAVPL